MKSIKLEFESGTITLTKFPLPARYKHGPPEAAVTIELSSPNMVLNGDDVQSVVSALCSVAGVMPRETNEFVNPFFAPRDPNQGRGI